MLIDRGEFLYAQEDSQTMERKEEMAPTDNSSCTEQPTRMGWPDSYF